MSNEKQETIADIVREMRTLGQLDEESTDKIPRSLQALGLRTYADRIEAACKKVTDCNRLDNAAEMREALEKIASMGEQIDYQLGRSEETVYALRHERCLAHNISECARAALSAPQRNCDVLSKSEVLEMLKDRSFSKEDTIEWLYEEAKGETK